MFDLHSHLPQKHHLFNSNFGTRHRNQPDPSPLEISKVQTNLPAAFEGGLSGIVANHYLPEFAFTQYSSVASLIQHFLKGKIEERHSPNRPFEQLLEMIAHFESTLAKTIFETGAMVKLCRSTSELMEATSSGHLAVVQAVEGAHCIAHADTPWETIERNIEHLYNRGIAMITIAHLYPNEFCSPVDSIPPSIKSLIRDQYNPDLHAKHLSTLGISLVEKLLDIGIIIDLTHCKPETRQQIYEINRSRAHTRPMTMSHVGAHGKFRHPYNANQVDIESLSEFGGTIGIILMDYWLTGEEDRMSLNRASAKGVFDSIQWIKDITGSVDIVSIGTDLDGLGDPTDAYYDYAQLRRLPKHMTQLGLTQEEVQKVTWRNSLELLMNGWEK